MPKTLYQKIFEKHTVGKLPSGQYQLFIGLHLLHEVTSPQAFSMLREDGLPALYPNRSFATVDHIIPTTSDERLRPLKDSVAEEMFARLEQNCKDFGIRFFGPEAGEQGVIHIVGPEEGVTQPGMTIACGDSHTATHGAFGSIAFGIGSSQVADVLATQTLAISPLKVRRIKFTGKLNKGVFPKDAALAYINKLGVNGGVGYAYEFSGAVVDDMDMEGRMTLCNLAIEGGARVGYCNPDEKTFDFLKGKPYAPKKENWDKAVEYWKSVASDLDAIYDDEVEIDCSKLAPFVTWGITPEQSVMINENIPVGVGEAYDYMEFKGGVPIAGVPIDIAFVGSCTNGRLSDLKAAAEILKGKSISPKVKLWVVPGSQKIKIEAKELGLDKVFKDAGAEWREAGCSLCLAMNPDKLQGKQISASSSNRNFKGRQGSPTGRTLLMSPAMVAAAAIKGCITDVREFI
ncbi:MAG: 3-isopropylmalate dehydratase large subunit [Fibromonadaceae bacterium]|jgi:3-isopropylmalate/(R)-2-methylmalate dehydratase large subunit|nr:3-isopropylmalate dehydratase large subunit [Fibromonadaceae bacterium]